MLNAQALSEDDLAGADRPAIMSALFQQLVRQQTSMALLLTGRMPHPETGAFTRELADAKVFVDQLEMLAEKTRGNLDAAEEKLLGECLAAARKAFAEALDQARAD